MTLDSVNRWRSLAGRAAALFCLLFLLSALDGLVSLLSQTPNDLRLLPGAAAAINGSASPAIRELQDLEYGASSDLMAVSFEKIHPGYWLGGLMWRGTLTTHPSIAPGEYRVEVRAKGEPSEKPMTAFRVNIFADPASLQQSSDSVIQRYTGQSPWSALALWLPLALGCVGIVYFCSQKRERFLRQEGKADIYRIAKTEAGDEVAFALGTGQGIRDGAVLRLLDREGIPVGDVVVKETYPNDAIATVPPDCSVKPGYMVSIRN
jgi:hypothetical protein